MKRFFVVLFDEGKAAKFYWDVIISIGEDPLVAFEDAYDES